MFPSRIFHFHSRLTYSGPTRTHTSHILDLNMLACRDKLNEYVVFHLWMYCVFNLYYEKKKNKQKKWRKCTVLYNDVSLLFSILVIDLILFICLMRWMMQYVSA